MTTPDEVSEPGDDVSILFNTFVMGELEVVRLFDAS